MKVDVYSVIRNEEQILPYFLRHYESFCERIFLYDDNSDDRTKDIAGQCAKVELRIPPYTGIDDAKQAELYGTAYRETSRGIADWVICVDSDEFVYHPKIQSILEKHLELGTQIIAPAGHEMLSDFFPSTPGQIYEEIKTGFSEPWYSKPIVFRPGLDMNFEPGRHNTANGPICKDSGLKLLHYRYLGLGYCESRNMRNASRLTEANKVRGYGAHVLATDNTSHSLKWYQEKALKERKNCLE